MRYSLQFLDLLPLPLQPTLKDGGSYVMEENESPEAKNTCVIFSQDGDGAGALAKMLKVFEEHNVNLVHIESRSSTRRPGYEFYAELDSRTGNLGAALEVLQDKCSYFCIISRDYKDNTGKSRSVYVNGTMFVHRNFRKLSAIVVKHF